MTSAPVDQGARDQALHPGRSFHIEAPAGSGKTAVLLARYLGLLSTVSDPGEIVALTFTRKAAGELRSRVVQVFLNRADPDPEASPVKLLLQELASRAFRHLDRLGLSPTEALAPERLQILTFHSLCSQLVALAPQEAGLPLEFTLVEGAEAQWLLEEALEELRRRLAARPPGDVGRQALERRLVRLNNNWQALAGELASLISRRDCLRDFLELARLSQDEEGYRQLSLTRLGQVLAPDLEALAAAWSATELAREWGGFLAYLHQQGAPLAATLPAQAPGGTLADLPAWRQLAQAFLTQKGTLRKSLTTAEGYPSGFNKTPWAGRIKALPPEVVELLGRFRDVPPPVILPEEVAALQDLVILLGEALAVYEEVCRRQGALDFIALEEAALRLLDREPAPDLLLRLDLRLHHLLVDEFQDTSLNQKRLLCRLLEGWAGGDGRTLTVVGDPKQSIYGWREARVEIFLEARKGLKCEEQGLHFPLQPLDLTTNFRSTRRLIDWVNGVFGETVLSPRANLRQVPFKPAHPGPGAGDGEPPCLMVFCHSDKAAAREAEARWLADQVIRIAPTLGPEERVGILLFARTHLSVYLAALQAAGQTVRVQEGLRLGDSRVVQHLHNLAKALSHPHDDLAWAGVLTGPWAPQPLAVVAQVAQPGEGLWPRRLARFLEQEECPPELVPVGRALLAAAAATGRLPLWEVLRDFLDQVAAWEGLAAWEGPLGVANARVYLELLARAETALPQATWKKAGIFLAEAYQPPDPRAQASPVELITVHGAKGLEFDWVLVPFLDWNPLSGPEGAPPFLLEEVPGTGCHALALARPYWESQQSLLYRHLLRLREERILAEARRVFYVAVTRAKTRLLLSAVLPVSASGKESLPSQSPLTWLWEHYRPESLPEGRGCWSHPELKVQVCSEWAAPGGVGAPPPEVPPAWDFRPEAAAYRLSQVTHLTHGSFPEGGREAEEVTEEGWPHLGAGERGDLLHRLLEAGLRGEALPDAAGVAAAMRRRGVPAALAPTAARDILTEAAACLADPFLRELAAAADLRQEWLLEGLVTPGEIRRGRPDLLARQGDVWWLVDFKSSRPPAEMAWDDFLAREVERHRPQLLAYRELAAARLGLSPDSLRPVLYFTACQRRVDLP
ncbi:MAG: UvrD-helicase domain-containing protein [Syntrophobacterales bacterium]|nr:UvrD-helicase domain-containing protein [Syntrophobacterales bacterium]